MRRKKEGGVKKNKPRSIRRIPPIPIPISDRSIATDAPQPDEGRKDRYEEMMMLTTTKISAVRAPTKTTRRAGVRQAAQARVAQKVRGIRREHERDDDDDDDDG